MLATLARGITGGKWYSLIDKLYPETTLRQAFDAVAANRGAAGLDHVGIEHYAANLDINLARLSEALRTDSYRPQAIRRHHIPKPGSQQRRPLGIPTVQDRVVQTALRMVLESRMRETCQSGSEGGGGYSLPTPIARGPAMGGHSYKRDKP
jgi:RNA-directed DNA polymerase